MPKAIKIVALLIFMVGCILVIFRLKCDDYSGCVESSTEYQITSNGSKLIAYDTIPVRIINSAKEYIRSQELNDSNILWFFENSQYTFNLKYPNASENDLYYVAESYLNIDTRGYFVLDKWGKVVEINELKTKDELKKIQANPEISSIEDWITCC